MPAKTGKRYKKSKLSHLSLRKYILMGICSGQDLAPVPRNSGRLLRLHRACSLSLSR